MAWSAKVGSIALNTTTGNQSDASFSFQPKAILFFGNHCTADGSVASLGTMVGMATSSTARGCIWTESLDAQATTATRRILRNEKCIALYSATTAKAVADLVSFNADGFTINNTTVDGTSRIVNYLGIGGTDITNVYCGTFTSPSSAGSLEVSDVGFQPDCVIVLASGVTPNTSPATGQSHMFSAWTGTTARWASSNRAQDSQTDTSKTRGYQRTDKCLAIVSTSTETVPVEADLTSFDSDGFTLNFSASVTVTNGYLYLALKGGSYKAGAITQPGSTGDQATSSVGFQPSVLLLSSDCLIASTSIQNESKRTIGAGTSASARGCIWAGDLDGAGTSVSDSNLDRTKIFKSFTPGTPTLESSADLKTLDSDGFTLTWGTADATARQIGYLAMGATPSAPGGNYVPVKMNTYRRRRS
jgi:hypothetical protein